jgi:hypothetical protein
MLRMSQNIVMFMLSLFMLKSVSYKTYKNHDRCVRHTYSRPKSSEEK